MVVDSVNVIVYTVEKKKDNKLRQANPPMLLISIHHTTVLATDISTEMYPTVFFPIAYTDISVISNVRET